MARRAVFLDRDGVLNESVYRDGISYPPADAETLVFSPGAVEAVARLHEADYLCICITNQPDVRRGNRTWENVHAMNEKVRIALKLDDLYVCLHDTPDNCPCRKPKPGMLREAAMKWDINLAKSWMVGDRLSDVEAGRAAGCRTIFIGMTASTNADMVCNTLPEAAAVILRESGKGKA